MKTDVIAELRARVAELETEVHHLAGKLILCDNRIAELKAECDKLITAVADHVTVRADQYQTIAAQALTNYGSGEYRKLM